MKTRKLKKNLRDAGWHFERQGATDHEIWKGVNPQTNKTSTTIIRNGKKDVRNGTLSAIRRQTGVTFFQVGLLPDFPEKG